MKLTVRRCRENLGIVTISVFALCMLMSVNIHAAQTIMDSFTRNVTGGFGETDRGNDWSHTGGISNFSVDGSKGIIAVTGGESSRHAVLIDAYIDTESLASISFDSEPTDSYIYGGLSLRVTGDNRNFYFARVRNSNGGIIVVLDRVVNGSATSLVNTGMPIPFTANDEYLIRFQATGTYPTALRAKIWPKSQAEPSSWSVVAEDSETILQQGGKAGIRAGTGSSYTGIAGISVDDYAVSECMNGECYLPDHEHIVTEPVFTPGNVVQYSDPKIVTAPDAYWVTAYDVTIPRSGGVRVEYTLYETGRTQYRSAVSQIYVNGIYKYRYATGDSYVSRLVNHNLYGLNAGDRVSVKIHVDNSAQAQYIDAHIKDFKLKTSEPPLNFIAN